MKIRHLSVKNCLSFGEQGLNKDNALELGDFNLLIGCNNAGKSNVFKLLRLLTTFLSNVGSAGGQLEEFPLAIGRDWVFGQELDTRTINFAFSIELEQSDWTVLKIPPYDHNHPDPISFLFERKNNWPKMIGVQTTLNWRGGTHQVGINKIEIPNDHPAYSKEPILFDKELKCVLALRDDSGREKVWKVIKNAHYPNDMWNNDFGPVASATKQFLTSLSDKLMRSIFVNIDAVRAIKLQGDEISETLDKLNNGEYDAQQMFYTVERFVNQLIFNNTQNAVKLKFSGNSGQKSITLTRGKTVLPLNYYGSAVEQMVTLATRIVEHGPSRIVLIEEPEAHFHPELQRKFLRFLRTNQEAFAHQYLIATHSNVFVDECANLGGHLFYVYSEPDDKTGLPYSQIEVLDQSKQTSLLKDLGVKPSDVLLANGLLVVEGPTDRDVYADWARKLGKPFEVASVLVLDAEGITNIKKYLTSEVIQKTCFQRYALYDKHGKDLVRKVASGIVPDQNLLSLKNGDIEDYYPRELVLEFARENAPKKGKTKNDVPNEIMPGETVKVLSELLNGEWWKTNLASTMITQMKPEQIDSEIVEKLTKIYDAIYS